MDETLDVPAGAAGVAPWVTREWRMDQAQPKQCRRLLQVGCSLPFLVFYPDVLTQQDVGHD